MLVKVNISLAVIREPPQHRRVWHFTQADWQGLQVAIKLLDWSLVSTLSNMNSELGILSEKRALSQVQIYPISSSVVISFLPPTVH